MKKKNWKISGFLLIALTLLFSSSAYCQENDGEGVFFDGLGRLVSLDLFPKFRSQRMLQASSYDRKGGNNDGFDGEFSTIRVEDNGEYVFFEDEGPACIYRFWTATPDGYLKIYFDGEEDPAYSAALDDFLGGKISPMEKPLCQFTSGGLNCYFPLCYEESIKFTLDVAPRFFQIDYATAEQPDKIFSYTPENIDLIKTYVTLASNIMNNRGGLFHKGALEKIAFENELSAGEENEIFVVEGSGKINIIQIDPGNASARDLKNISLLIFWDREEQPAVDVPLLRFFATDFVTDNYKSLFVGKGDNFFYSYFPMPFKDGARIVLANNGKAPITLSGNIGYSEESMPDDFGYFHAYGHRLVSEEEKPIVINEIEGGRGHWIGTAISAFREKDNDDNFRFLEGDERVYIDGETEPIWSGTGTEDYFGGGWYFTSGEFSRSFHGAPVIKKKRSSIAMYRFHFTDAIPFEESIRFEIEHGGHNSQPGVMYDVVGYWYQKVPGKTGM